MAGRLKGSEGLSQLARQMLELAGNALTKKEKKMLWSMRLPATTYEVEALFLKVQQEWKASAGARARAEIQRQLDLAYWNEVNPEEPSC